MLKINKLNVQHYTEYIYVYILSKLSVSLTSTAICLNQWFRVHIIHIICGNGAAFRRHDCPNTQTRSPSPAGVLIQMIVSVLHFKTYMGQCVWARWSTWTPRSPHLTIANTCTLNTRGNCERTYSIHSD